MPNVSVSKYGHLKYQITAADLVAQGAATTFDFPVDSLPPGAVVYSSMLKSATGITGMGATHTAQFKLGGTLIGTAIDPSTATGTVSNTAASGSLTAASAVVINVTGANAFSTYAGGPIEGTLNYTVMAP